MASRKARSRYQPHPMLAREKEARGRIEEKTGRPFDQWVVMARKRGIGRSRELSTWLREEHGLGSRDAMWIASAALSPDQEAAYEDPVKLVEALYSGNRASLRPLHEKVVDLALELGPDVLVTSCKTMVPIYRRHVFAELRPVTGGVEVELALGDEAPGDRFEPARSRDPGDRMTHRVVLGNVKDLDRGFKECLERAYEIGAGKRDRSREDLACPPALSNGLSRTASARSTWEACTPAMRRDWIQWIGSAKQEATRSKRIEQALEKLASGKKRMY